MRDRTQMGQRNKHRRRSFGPSAPPQSGGVVIEHDLVEHCKADTRAQHAHEHVDVSGELQITRDELSFEEADQLKDPAPFVTRTMALYADPGRESLDVLKFKDGRPIVAP